MHSGTDSMGKLSCLQCISHITLSNMMATLCLHVEELRIEWVVALVVVAAGDGNADNDDSHDANRGTLLELEWCSASSPDGWKRASLIRRLGQKRRGHVFLSLGIPGAFWSVLSMLVDSKIPKRFFQRDRIQAPICCQQLRGRSSLRYTDHLTRASAPVRRNNSCLR